MIPIVRRRAVVVVTLAIMMFTATSSVLFELQSAPAAFAGSADYVIYSGDAPTIFSSRIDVGIVPLLLAHASVTDAWAEVVTFSIWDDESFVVRGMDVERMLQAQERIERTNVEPTSIEITSSTAIVGTRLMDRLDIETPCAIPLSGSYASHVNFVQIVGWFETGSPLDDELVVSEDVARHLSGMPSDCASMIAVATDDPSWVDEMLSPEGARFALFDIRASKTTAVTGETVTLLMEVHNWGTAGGEATVLVTDDGITLDEITLSLDASASTTVESQIEFYSKGVHPLSIRLTGDFPSDVALNVSVVDPYIVLSAPSRVVVTEPFEVRVLDYDADPVSGAEISYLSGDLPVVATADDEGVAEIVISTAGSCLLTASHSNYTNASTTVEVIDLADYPEEFLPGVRSFALSADVISESEAIEGVAVVENSGAVGGVFNVTVSVDSVSHTVLNVQLGPVEVATLSFSISGIGLGAHTIQVGTFSYGFFVEPWFADESDMVQLALRYGGTGIISSSASIPIYEAAKISEGNVAVALFSVGAVSALLTGLAISAVFAKEIRDGRRTLGILRTIGASKRNIRTIVLFQTLLNSLVGAMIGVAAGLTLVYTLTEVGAFHAFGHTLSFEPNAALLVVVVLAAAAISLFSSFVSAEVAARSTPISAIGDLDESGSSGEMDLEELLSEQ